MSERDARRSAHGCARAGRLWALASAVWVLSRGRELEGAHDSGEQASIHAIHFRSFFDELPVQQPRKRTRHVR